MNEFDNYCNEANITGDDIPKFRQFCLDKTPSETDYRKAYPRFRDLWLCFLLEDSMNMMAKILGAENE